VINWGKRDPCHERDYEERSIEYRVRIETSMRKGSERIKVRNKEEGVYVLITGAEKGG